jgi:hypothetical protein
MEIILYNNKSPKNKIGKTLTNPNTITGSLRGETSISNFQMLLNIVDLNPYNYMYIADFGKYYFITNIISVRTGLWLVTASIDVLESYKSEILSLDVILSTTESTGSKQYKMGSCWDVLVKDKTDIISFSDGLLTTGEFILITAGG